MVMVLYVVAALCALWVAQAVLSVLLVRKMARRFDRPTRPQFLDYHPPAAVVVPFKGLDLELRESVRGLCAQNYPEYRLLLVVESEDDPAYAVLKDELARCERPAEVLVAGLAGPREGQKVHNLLAAVAHLERQAQGEVVWAFADSDAVPGPHWLASLVGPLVQDRVGVTTGYRWFVPPPEARESSAKNVPLATHFASVMNSSVACWAGRNRLIHAWGGSMAMRVETAREGDLAGYWRGSLSDDYQVTRMCRDLGLRIHFVRACLVASPVEFDFKGLWSFARRQYIITRTHAPWLYTGALVVLTMYVMGAAVTWGSLIYLLATDLLALRWLVPFAALVVVMLADVARWRYRRQIVRRAFGEPMVSRLRRTLALDREGPLLWMTLHWLIVVSALFGRTITWRGNRYRINGPQAISTPDDAD